ncbi:SulP family inorganic anion transporter [Geofilum rubicundum]|uniref:Sulfate permease n=1 Tax=Geofilum rubicundum JCM 15548 TaxID=1236989 RepID=A0A0E9LT27_9BACT|nr:SulP family inorganic anion transporter [Geofilum rubicundum]GAO28311.1 sulfate permease [Geofilum rubicundum JCM 15548]
MEPLFLPKILTTFKEGYTRQQLLRDVMAGTIVGVVALPLAIAFAIASGVSPEKGLLTAVVAGFLISLMGGSRVQIGGPTGAFVVIVAGIIATYGLDGLIISTIMAGVIMIVFGLFRLGAVIRFIPYPLTVGFTSGIALLIFVSQIKDFFGLQTGELPADFAAKMNVLMVSFHTVQWSTLLLGLVSFGLTMFWGKISSRVPGSLIALLLGAVLVALGVLNVDTIGSKFGEIPSAISMPSLPNLSWDLIIRHIGPAFTIALLGSIESLLSAVVSDGMIGGRHRSNTELIAQGVANIGSGLFGGIPATGAIARTATNVKNGGRTPVAGLVHAVVLLIIMLFAGKWAGLIPLSVLAGILMVVAYNMSEWRSFVSIMRGSRYDVLVLLTSFVLTVVVDLTIAIQVGMVLAALLFMKRMADVGEVRTLVNYPDDEVDDAAMVRLELPASCVVYEVSGPLFFGVANKFKELMHNIPDRSTIVIIRMRHVPMIDATGIHNLKALLQRFIYLKKQVILTGVNPEVAEALKQHGIWQLIGGENVLPLFEEAVSKVKGLAARD